MKKHTITDDMLTPPMLIGRIARVHRCALRARENDPIMSQNSSRTLLFCLSREEGITQLELAKAAGLKPPTVSVALRHLEEEGYIIRKADEEDMRAVHVYLSEKGHALERDNIERIEALDSEMMVGFSPEETEILRKMLLRIMDNLENPKGDEE